MSYGRNQAARLRGEPLSQQELAFSALAEFPTRAVLGSSAPGRGPFKVVDMKYMLRMLALLVIAFSAVLSAGQAGYQVVSVQDGGTIKGTVKWQGALPHLVPSRINGDPQNWYPLGQKHRAVSGFF